METKLKHLEFVQNVITRMGGNSFLLKGWTVTVVGGLFALSLKEFDPRYLLVSLVVLVFFWLLDSHYLIQERLFIKLFDHVRHRSSDVDFTMDTKPFRKEVSRVACAFSWTMYLFYGGLIIVHGIIFIILTTNC